MSERREGYYRVKRHNMPEEYAWTIAEWDEDCWWLIGDREHYDDDTFAEIDERPIERSPAAQAGEVEAAVMWRCFHCDEVFESRECAAHHFGHNEGETPICKIKGAGEYALISALRKAQQQRDEAWNALSAEDTDSARVIYAMRADHAVELRREEEAGYAKGLRDAEAAAATRAAQERRLAVEMREVAASLLQSESNSWRERATYLRAAVTRMGTGAPRCDERAYTLGECADGLDSKIAAIRALLIPGEEEKA